MIMLTESYRANYNVIRPSSYLFYEDALTSNVVIGENDYTDFVKNVLGRRVFFCPDIFFTKSF